MAIGTLLMHVLDPSNDREDFGLQVTKEDEGSFSITLTIDGWYSDRALAEHALGSWRTVLAQARGAEPPKRTWTVPRDSIGFVPAPAGASARSIREQKLDQIWARAGRGGRTA